MSKQAMQATYMINMGLPSIHGQEGKNNKVSGLFPSTSSIFWFQPSSISPPPTNLIRPKPTPICVSSKGWRILYTYTSTSCVWVKPVESRLVDRPSSELLRRWSTQISAKRLQTSSRASSRRHIVKPHFPRHHQAFWVVYINISTMSTMMLEEAENVKAVEIGRQEGLNGSSRVWGC
jgi:hypothetical protein